MAEIEDVKYAKPEKPLGIKAYGSTPHLIGSRVGPADHTMPLSQSLLFTSGKGRPGDRFVVSEKMDGSCCAVAKSNGNILALQRAGYFAEHSPYELHRVFHRWVLQRAAMFDEMLAEGERLCGEWLHTAMGTLYRIDDPDQLFVGFSIIGGQQRIPYDDFAARCRKFDRPTAHVLSDGPPLPVETALEMLGEKGFHGALDGTEGVVYLHEKKGRFCAIGKYVKQGKVDGRHMSSITGGGDVVNYVGPAI